MSQYKPTTLTVSLSAIANNFRMAGVVTQGKVKRMAVVKANAYGHGMIPVAQRLLREGADALAVAAASEALALREAGVRAHTLVLGGVWQGDIVDLVHNHVAVAVYDVDTLRRLDQAAERLGTVAHAHLKVDTGMGRLGVKRWHEMENLLDEWGQTKRVKMEGIFTHFANADGDPAYTNRQNMLFNDAVGLVRRMKFDPIAHAAASTGMLAGSEYWHDMVRPGIMLYGAEVTYRFSGLQQAQRLETYPVRIEWLEFGETVGYGRTFKCERPTRVMTLPVGYADGYSRDLSNRADVLVCGKRAPVIGRVCMDQMMVDVTDIPEADMTSEVVLLGKQGEQRITPDELARLSGTIPYEIMTGFGPRIKRRIID